MWFLCFVTAVLHLIRHLKEATQGIHTENHCIKKLNATFFSTRMWLLTRRQWKPKMPCHGDTWEQRLHLVNVRIIHMNCQTVLCVMGQSALKESIATVQCEQCKHEQHCWKQWWTTRWSWQLIMRLWQRQWQRKRQLCLWWW